MAYLEHLAILACIYFLLTYSLNLLVGYAGLISLCHAALFGFGAYFYSITVLKTSISPIIVLSITACAGGLFAIALGYICLRGRREVFTFITLALQMIFFIIIYNNYSLTRGAYGISGVARLTSSRSVDEARHAVLILLLTTCIAVAYILGGLMRSAFGLSIRALRDHERAAEGFGISFYGQMVRLFGLAGLIAAFTGGAYAAYIGYISPSAFSLDESFMILVALSFGGSNEKGAKLVGVLAIVGLPEIFGWLELPSALAANLRALFFELSLIALIFLRLGRKADVYARG